MRKNIVAIGLLALSIGALAPQSGHAQATPSTTYNDGDLLLGVWNSSKEYVLDLGSLSNFNFAQGFTISDGVTNIAHDLALSSIFGTSWYTTSGIYFALLGTDYGNPDAYVTNPEGSSVLWPNASVVGAISNYINNYGTADSTGYGAHPTVTGQTSDGTTEASSAANSFYSFAAYQGAGNGPFGNDLDAPAPVVGDGGIGATLSASTNFQFMDGYANKATALGNWTLSSNGDLNYSVVPEPSTYAALGCGALALLAARRRRRA